LYRHFRATWQPTVQPNDTKVSMGLPELFFLMYRCLDNPNILITLQHKVTKGYMLQPPLIAIKEPSIIYTSIGTFTFGTWGRAAKIKTCQ